MTTASYESETPIPPPGPAANDDGSVSALAQRAAYLLKSQRWTELAAAVAELQRLTNGPLELEKLGAADIFADQDPVPWLCQSLHWCPGRPSMIAGYSYSGKTLLASAAAVAIATAKPIWGQFIPNRRGRVLHLDYDQGRRATLRRYRRIAQAMGVGEADVEGWIDVVPHPRLYLNTPGAEDSYAKLCEGYALVIVDAFRGAVPGQDENDSLVSEFLYMLGRVSERVGATFLVIHHSGKPQEGHNDARMKVRGSSAIFGACGCVFIVGGDKGGLKSVVQQKSSAEADDGLLAPFKVSIENVQVGDDPSGGLCVLYDVPETPSHGDPDQVESDVLAEKVLAAVRTAGTVEGNRALCELVSGRQVDIRAAARRLVLAGRLTNCGSDSRPRYREAS